VHDQWELMALAIPASYFCGVLSWRFIEEPTQRLRRHLRAPNAATVRLQEDPFAMTRASGRTLR
jgi:peptidoglycan/LPS O-acetylase OafA/YrhL